MSESMLDDEDELLRLDTQGGDARHVGFGLALKRGQENRPMHHEDGLQPFCT